MLARIFLALAGLLPLAAPAFAVECTRGQFTPAALRGPCGGNAAISCMTFQTDFIAACERAFVESRTVQLRHDRPGNTQVSSEEYKASNARYAEATAALDEAVAAAKQAEKGEFSGVPAFVDVSPDLTGIKIIALRADADAAAANLVNFERAFATPLKASAVGPESPAPLILAPETLNKAVDLALKGAGGPEKVQQAGERSLAANQPAQAERYAQALIDKAPKDSRGPTLMAEAALKTGRPADAERWAQKALELNPADKKAQDVASFARSELSAARLKKPVVGNFQEARGRDLERALAAPARPAGPAGPAGPAPVVVKEADPAPRVLAGLLRRGYEKMNMGDHLGALEDLSVHLDGHPDDSEARLVRAEVLLKLVKPQAALADIDLVLAKAPDDPRALRARAAALYELWRDDEALAAIDRSLAIEPASGIAHLTRAKVLERKGRTAEAVGEYRAAAQLDPTLEPIVEAALRRLGAAPAAKEPKAVERRLLRGSFIVVSLGLILLGLAGGAIVATRRARAPEAAAAGSMERTLRRGDLVAGQYRIERVLGRGGMGVVFEAVDEKLKRSVALKQLQGDYRASAEEAARFLQEARLVAQLKHPNVAEIYAAVEDAGLYLVFEFVRGRSLDAALDAGVSAEQARGIVAHVCSALTAAHARRIVHRDLKPSNLMISDEGQIKVMDFGIAHQSVHGNDFTKTSASGTPPYMAPEQAMGSVSSASDLYALGVMAYELLAGGRPFNGPDFLGPKLRGEFETATSRRPSLPPKLDAFFASALSPDPSRRPVNAEAFASAFAACWS